MRVVFVVFISLITFSSFSQQEMKFSGIVNDTINKQALDNAVIMAVRLSDGMLLGFTRSKSDGSFELTGVPIDTMELVVSHYKFDEKRYYIIGSKDNYEINIPNIILPDKATTFDEIVIYANKEPIYFRGDTLVFVADSFATKENATVEDLLKNLPGIQVDDNGNISSQGRQITKVLVDGDEFFGADPTIATRNLIAKGVDKVEIYETEDDNSGGNSEDKIQVLDVKLKDDSKQGYFGKIAGSGGANSEYFKNLPNGSLFHEGEALVNYFNQNLKVSVFGLGSNTPNTSFNYNDASRFGLTNEMPGRWQSFMSPTRVTGFPQNYKGGFYFSNRFNDKIKLGMNYTYNDSRLTQEQNSDAQYFFEDTSYVKRDSIFNYQSQQSHTINFDFEYKANDKTTFNIKSNLILRQEENESDNSSDFYTPEQKRFSASTIKNNGNAEGLESNIELNYAQKFDKRNRSLNAVYQFGYTENDRNNTLKSDLFYSNFNTPDSIFDQKRNRSNQTAGHRLLLDYIEPLSQQFRLKLQYRIDYFFGSQTTSTYDRSPIGEYDIFADLYSNDFSNTRLENRGTLGVLFTNRKQTIEVGSRIRNVNIDNFDNQNNSLINQNVDNILPYVEYNFKFSNSHRLRFTYTTSSNQPSIDQLQPVMDNTDPNNLVIGNPNLTPNYAHNFNTNYNKWNAINYSFIYGGAYFNYTDNDFSNSVEYLPNGRTIANTVNVDGNIYGGFYGGGGFPVYKKLIHLRTNLSGNYYNFKSYINNVENKTENYGLDGSLTFEMRTDSIEVKLSGGISYNNPRSTLSMGLNEPYFSQRYSASVFFELPWFFFVESDVTYEINTQRTEGYNVTPFIWNAKLNRRFTKTGNLVVNIAAYDIFNQNVSVSRNVGRNIITDTRSKIIARYFMLGVTWRFNNNKIKEDEGRGQWF